MLVETTSIVLPEAVWAYLLHREGMHSGWLLPFEGQQDVEQGKLWLVRQGLLIASETVSVLHTPLQQTMTTIAQAVWALHVRTGALRASLMKATDTWLLARSMRSSRIAVSKHDEPVAVLEAAVAGEEAAYGMQEAGKALWQGSLAWDDAKSWLESQVQGR